VPVRTGIGAMAITFFLLVTISGGNDHVAHFFQISLNAMTWFGRIGVIILPPIAYYITHRICVGLQRSDRAVLEHGIETGVIKQMPNGAFVEIHQPLGPVDEHGHPVPLAYAGATVPKRMNQLGFADRIARGSLIKADDQRFTDAAVETSHANEREEKAMLENLQDANRAKDREAGLLD